MNATSLAKSAYASSSIPIRTERSTEYGVFSRITRRLTEDNAARNYADYVQALHDNRNLWTLLAVDVADEKNALPQTLRARIFYLAEFTHLHTSKILSGSAGPEVLIDINSAIMRGLRQNGEG